MSDHELPETIPISYLNALEYCPRRFHYEFVQGDMLVNDFVLGGTLLHERADEPGKHTSEDGGVQINWLYLDREKLRLSGFADVIEEHDGLFVPVEYKHGRQGRWFNDHIQLCAQALCLEERQPGKPPIPYGYIFYIGSRRRVQVHFTQQLRAKTRAAIVRALQVAALETPPPPLSGKMAARCPHCSLLPLCLPEEVRLVQSQKRK